MIIVGVLDTLEKPIGNFMDVLSQAHMLVVTEIIASGGDSNSSTLSKED